MEVSFGCALNLLRWMWESDLELSFSYGCPFVLLLIMWTMGLAVALCVILLIASIEDVLWGGGSISHRVVFALLVDYDPNFVEGEFKGKFNGRVQT